MLKVRSPNADTEPTLSQARTVLEVA
jgi:hypothetical protein